MNSVSIKAIDLDTMLQTVVATLDISPTDFNVARSRYRSTREWLLAGDYRTGSAPRVYLQGSFRLGTVIRPFYGDRDGDFDIDQVFEFTQPYEEKLPSELKREIGDRLKEHATYRGILDQEGKRCWTLQYASEKGRPGFHIDILPSKHNVSRRASDIAITNKNQESYSWQPSSPEGYYRWFKRKNHFSTEFVTNQSNELFVDNQDIYATREAVPKRLLRSSLQRAIQLMKRHRDVYFSNRDFKPISIIITTIAAHLYDGKGIAETVESFVDYVSKRHSDLVTDGYLSPDGILDYVDGRWSVLNPSDADQNTWEAENFADRWNIEANLPIAFFKWARDLQLHLSRFAQSSQPNDLKLKVTSENQNEDFATQSVRDVSNKLKSGQFDTSSLLGLIFLGIEGEIKWNIVEQIARSFVGQSDSVNDDIARINFYQVRRHQGLKLIGNAREDVLRIVQKNSQDAAFVFCGNLLLGTATFEMLKNCINALAYKDVLSWPIIELADPHILFPPI